MGHQETGERPRLLAPDTFTSPARTPWGGHRIRALKGLAPGPVVGEAWELSVEPSHPSRLADGRLLEDALAAAPDAWLGREGPAGSTGLLVKLLDTEAPLSVQIHPRDDDPALGPDESGKPESWYVVAAEPGAGLYLGLRPGVDRAAVERALDEGSDLSALLPFVPVEPGDFFVIEAGTPHCIGPGVLLVEPQRVSPGRRGLTYRYWDWNRRYDPDGREAPSGAPRPLHRARALEVTDWARASDPNLLARVRHRAGPAHVHSQASLTALGGPDERCPVRSSSLRVSRVTGEGDLALPDWGGLSAITVLAGEVRLGDLVITPGRTAAIPASWSPRRAQLRHAHAILSALA